MLVAPARVPVGGCESSSWRAGLPHTLALESVHRPWVSEKTVALGISVSPASSRSYAGVADQGVEELDQGYPQREC